MNLGALSAEMFALHLGSDFVLEGPDGVIDATLVRCPVNPKGTHPDAARTAFSLILSATADGVPNINGGHFLVHHAELGAFGPVYVERILSSQPSEAMLQIIFN